MNLLSPYWLFVEIPALMLITAVDAPPLVIGVGLILVVFHLLALYVSIRAEEIGL